MAIIAHSRVIDGITCYAPSIAEDYGSYPADGFDVTVEVEQASFWCRSRNRLVHHLVQRFAPRHTRVRFLEIGCGTGNVLNGLLGLPGVELTGSEIYLAGLRHAKRRFPDIGFVQIDATAMPFDAEFDAIGAFDVIEHIADDRVVLRNVHRSLTPGGVLFVTVPQYPWMWSRLDELVHHQRRYTRGELCAKLREAGFALVYVSSFVTVLFPLMAAARLFKRNRDAGADAKAAFVAEVQLPPTLNRIFDAVMRVDEWLVRRGVPLPFGGSLVAVARKV